MQYLIVVWPFVLLIGAAAVVSLSILQFHRTGATKARELLARAPHTPPEILTERQLAPLPPVVQRWLPRSGAGAGAHHATQYFTVDAPGFVWLADVRLLQVIPIVGRDCLIHGRGRMQIALGGLIPLADGIGPGFDQGTALRFLGEIVWFPSAAAAGAIRWRALDVHRAEATLTARDVEVSAIFTFDDLGRFVRLEADRSYNGGAAERWEIPATHWSVIRGVEIPVSGQAVWKRAAGDFSYFDWEITDVETNRPSLWGEDPS